MKFPLTEFLVLGAKKFADRVEGTMYDFTKLVVVMDQPESENNRGMNSVELKWGDSKNFDQVKDLNFPAKVQLELLATTKGYEIVSVKVPAALSVSPAKQAA